MKHVEFTAVILASTCGARLYPLTSSSSSSSSTADSMPMGKDALTSSLNTATVNNTYDHRHDNDKNDHPNGENAHDATLLNQQEQQQQQQQQGIAASGETYMPKHLLPLAGRPILFHLVEHCEKIGMTQIIIAIGSEDHQLGMTQRSLLSMMRGCTHRDAHSVLQGGDSVDAATDLSSPSTSSSDGWQYGNARIVIVPLPADCGGSADALRHVVSSNVIRTTLSGKNHVMVLPADLVLYGHLGRENEDAIMKKSRDSSSSGSMGVCHTTDTTPESAAGSILFWNALGSLANVHRREYRAGLKKGMPLAMTMLLADVGEEDESGIPLKESAKAKKGGIARDEEDIEYIGISTIDNQNRPPTQRIVFKQSKYNVEEDIDNTGATPKLHIPKARLHSPMNQIMIKSSWSDLHVFCFSPWALNLLLVKDHMKELGKDFVPFLVSRQFRGLKASFGKALKNNDLMIKESEGIDSLLIETMDELNLGGNAVKRKRGSMLLNAEDNLRSGMDDSVCEEDCPFMVSAHVLSRECSKLSLRACTIPSYMYACREVVAKAINSSAVVHGTSLSQLSKSKKSDFGTLCIPEGTLVDEKFNCLVLPDAIIGEKVQIKSCTIGNGVSIGNRCRLNNVVVHDNVVIGENTILQNSTLSKGCVIGMNCNLNECQVGIGAEVPVGTKAKGEGF